MAAVKIGNVIYGKLRECIEEYWKLVDVSRGVFPDFDFAAEVQEEISEEEAKELGKEIYLLGHSWFGCKNKTDDFDSEGVQLIFGYYGGSEITNIVLEEGDENLNRAKVTCMIGFMTDQQGFGVLDPEDYTVFEIQEEEEEEDEEEEVFIMPKKEKSLSEVKRFDAGNKPMVSFGKYINFWTTGGDYDVFVIFNEANDQMPSFDEFNIIEAEIRSVFEDEDADEYGTEGKRQIAQARLDALSEDLSCLKYGGQIVVASVKA